MTPSSRAGRRVALSATTAFGFLLAAFAPSHVSSAPVVLNASPAKAAAQAQSANQTRWSKPAGQRINHIGSNVGAAVLGVPRAHHQLVASPHRRPTPAFIAPVASAPPPTVTSVVDHQTTIVQAQPQVVYLQPQCAAPLIIRIEPRSDESDRRGRRSQRRGRTASTSPQMLYGASHPCVPEVATIRQRDLQGPRVLSVRN